MCLNLANYQVLVWSITYEKISDALLALLLMGPSHSALVVNGKKQTQTMP